MSAIFRLGLNPYGMTFTVGLQAIGTARANPQGIGLDGFVGLARNIEARTLELDLRWLVDLDDQHLRALAGTAEDAGMTVICSTWLQHQPEETLADARRIARTLGASLVRLHLAPVLEGARAAQGERWHTLVAHARHTLVREAAIARDEGVRFGIENHQDFGSEELLAMAAEAGSNVGIVLDTGNPFAVGEDPVAFAARVAARLVHVHLKDYRAQFTGEGYRLTRCAIGEGCVPFDDIAAVIAPSTPDLPVTASLELAALDARHIRVFTPGWWQYYPPREAGELGVALGRLRRNAWRDQDDARTPWERQADPDVIRAYEREQLERSVNYVRAAPWMRPGS